MPGTTSCAVSYSIPYFICTQWLEGYLKQQSVPMVVVSHDREFLDQLCTKVVETERGVSTTYNGNYTQFVNTKVRAPLHAHVLHLHTVEGAKAQAGVGWHVCWLPNAYV